MKADNEIIKIENLSFSYNTTPLLDNINLTVFEDDFLGIVGPNGGGKSTLIKLILGLLIPQAGSISVLGESPIKVRDQIGYLSQFEDVDFDFPISVFDIVLMGRINTNIFKRYSQSDKQKTRECLEKMGISHLLDRNLSELSGGEKQRTFLARALVSDPKILILDEPLLNIDIKMQEDLYELLKELNSEVTIIIVDHNIEALARYVKRIACINKCDHHSLKYHEDVTQINKI